MPIDGGQFLDEMRSKDPRLSLLLQRIIDGVNQTANSLGTDSSGHIAPPAPPSAINVAAGSDHVHVTVSDHTQRSRALNYFVEYTAGDPNFLQPHVVQLGASRGTILALPAKDGTGATQSYYFRSYSMYPGSQTASPKIVHGGTYTPMPVTLTGSSQLTLLPSTGSGTAPSNGQRGGKGFGTDQYANQGA